MSAGTSGWARPRYHIGFARQADPLPVNAPAPSLLQFPFDAPPAPGEPREIAPGIHWIRMPLPFALDHINLWLARDADGGWTAVDAGYVNDTTRGLWERHFVSTLGGRPIGRIVATHHHPDHLGNRSEEHTSALQSR